ncbi:MAG TPA: hypothetical protein VJG30_00055 [Candidatus Nanoarchaeia archaeon]|nr:hypothetical protein [Candidatus Nanoarchaeia archaeon]
MTWREFYNLVNRNIPRENKNKPIIIWAIETHKIREFGELWPKLGVLRSIVHEKERTRKAIQVYSQCPFSETQLKEAFLFVRKNQGYFLGELN